MQVLPPSPGRPLLAHILPFFAFAALSVLGEVRRFAGFDSPLFLQHPEFFVYPLQTIVCGYLIWRYRRDYPFAFPKRPGLSVIIGVAVFVLWISPQAFFHSPPRSEDGFNPDVLTPGSALWAISIGMRFLRLVVVVPLFEEIFWRSFLLRYLTNERFVTVPLGRSSPIAFGAVALLFMLAHQPPDYPAALLTGLIYNGWMAWNRNLADSVIVHAVTNLALGIYILQTSQWGFW